MHGHWWWSGVGVKGWWWGGAVVGWGGGGVGCEGMVVVWGWV